MSATCTTSSANSGCDNLIKLEQNYRSHGHILDAANPLIAQQFATRSARTCGPTPVTASRCASTKPRPIRRKRGWIVEEIKALINTGLARGEIAVLYRSNAQSRMIEHTLVNAGIPYRVYGGLRFFERQEVKHALAYLRLIDNPNDDTAFAARRELSDARHRRALDRATRRTPRVSTTVRWPPRVPYVTGKAGSSLGGFATLIAKMRAERSR